MFKGSHIYKPSMTILKARSMTAPSGEPENFFVLFAL